MRKNEPMVTYTNGELEGAVLRGLTDETLGLKAELRELCINIGHRMKGYTKGTPLSKMLHPFQIVKVKEIARFIRKRNKLEKESKG